MGRLSSTSTRGSQGKRRRKQPSGERGENGGASATGRPGADVFFASAAHTKPAHKQPGLSIHHSQPKAPRTLPLDPPFSVRHSAVTHACWLRRRAFASRKLPAPPLAPPHCGPQPLGACSLPARHLGPIRQPVNPRTPSLGG